MLGTVAATVVIIIVTIIVLETMAKALSVGTVCLCCWILLKEFYRFDSGSLYME
jgi:hypothetical protein